MTRVKQFKGHSARAANAGGRARLPAPRRRSFLIAPLFRSRAHRIALVAALAACAALASSVVYNYNAAALAVDERLAAGYLTSRAGVYAAPRVLRVGQRLSRERLVESLRRGGYVESGASGVWSGGFVAGDEGVEIRPGSARTDRSADALGFTPGVVRVRFDAKDAIAEITGDEVALESFTLEPELLTPDAAMKTARNSTLAFADIPPALVGAITAIEDRRFFSHHGLDPVGVLRAAASWAGLGAEAGAPERQGGSTITQQLVKNTYLTPERTLSRKFREALLAFALERRLSKPDIFALYCNEIYLGRRGASSVRGVRQAARAYFGKDLRELSPAEAATIAGMIQSPARYAPDRHPDASRARRNAVLAAMLRDGSLTREEAARASEEPVVVAPASHAEGASAPYFVDYVNRAVEARLDERADADERSLRVYTTLDADLQRLAESAVEKQLARLDERFAKGARGRCAARAGVAGCAKPQAALVAIDPRDGRVVAMVGGRDYGESQLNRATDARRQPGSVFKPIVYAAAVEGGASPAAMFADAPRDFKFDPHAPAYRPANYGGAFSMRDVTMRTALVKSLNVVTVDLAMRTGLDRVARLAESFGLPRPAAYPSLALGTTEATPLEIAAAYTAFANNGARVAPRVVARASDSRGTALVDELPPAGARVVRPSTAYIVTDMLSAVLDHGTARAARGLQKISAAAGKTGTSRDGWFAGYTPNLVCVVWVGFDDNTPLDVTGADSALPAWSEFMRGALDLRPELGAASFVVPDGVTSAEIDPDTGMLASESCPARELVALTPALAPRAECAAHGGFDAVAGALAAADTDAAAPHAPAARDSSATRGPSAPQEASARGDETTAAGLRLTPRPASKTMTEVSRAGRAVLTNDLQLARDQERRR
ncbi:MAG TPA: PBP1A family penicillin-binding protein [Pyrinomonadaceae bacterium]|jgi:penicillin-binding protein 1B|nr:PBP1A family penicillin-binding protein [Pyrinomonadaceae bacterium]